MYAHVLKQNPQSGNWEHTFRVVTSTQEALKLSEAFSVVDRDNIYQAFVFDESKVIDPLYSLNSEVPHFVGFFQGKKVAE